MLDFLFLNILRLLFTIGSYIQGLKYEWLPQSTFLAADIFGIFILQPFSRVDACW
jgi:hypothetical protein